MKKTVAITQPASVLLSLYKRCVGTRTLDHTILELLDGKAKGKDIDRDLFSPKMVGKNYYNMTRLGPAVRDRLREYKVNNGLASYAHAIYRLFEANGHGDLVKWARKKFERKD